jgi:hypothetical protein
MSRLEREVVVVALEALVAYTLTSKQVQECAEVPATFAFLSAQNVVKVDTYDMRSDFDAECGSKTARREGGDIFVLRDIVDGETESAADASACRKRRERRFAEYLLDDLKRQLFQVSQRRRVREGDVLFGIVTAVVKRAGAVEHIWFEDVMTLTAMGVSKETEEVFLDIEIWFGVGEKVVSKSAGNLSSLLLIFEFGVHRDLLVASLALTD